MLVEKDTSLSCLAHLMLDLKYFMYFQDADGGHLGFRGQADLKTLK
jgi:hypothetical protein